MCATAEANRPGTKTVASREIESWRNAVSARQIAQRLIEHQDLAGARLGRADMVVQRHFHIDARAFDDVMPTRMIDEHAPHHLRRHAEEMCAILPG